ncbi:DUF397 domain-containing protein [Actinomadura sp. BRA 177]|nr:DUF397 domain-containing protein [Actinomadura sp. BRA 177]
MLSQTRVHWKRSSHSGSQGGSQCVELAVLRRQLRA